MISESIEKVFKKWYKETTNEIQDIEVYIINLF